MLLIDDLLLAPVKGLMFVFEEIAKQADEELYSEEGVRRELTTLYVKLEIGAITETEFTVRESELIERLEEIERRKAQDEGTDEE
jgi:hypothetical protein